MRENIQSNRDSFIGSWTNNSQYFDMLKLMSSLSKLFSENSTPYLDYRLAENLFCKCFDAINDARSCTAYDARLGNLGIGIKTFGISSGSSVEKIAEFNKLKYILDQFSGEELAFKLCEFRNDRIDVANDTYDVTDALYHIVGRKDGALSIFNTPYEKIDTTKIHSISESEKSISFNVGNDFYSFNKSKSVLMKRFELPAEHKDINVDIIDEPLELLASLLGTGDSEITNSSINSIVSYKPKIKGYDYVILPLYSTRSKIIHVPVSSGLNQWNAGGRRRTENEVYIPVPRLIHKNYPDFFPDRYIEFELVLPNQKRLSAKICQANGKALMSNPNSELGEYLLRKVLRKKTWELVTMDDLIRFGIDSVYVENTHTKNAEGKQIYKLSFTNTDYESYGDFIEDADQV